MVLCSQCGWRKMTKTVIYGNEEVEIHYKCYCGYSEINRYGRKYE